MRDVKNDALMTYVRDARRYYSRSVTRPYTFDASLRAWYGVAGPRFEVGRRVRLYAEALGGVILLEGNTYLAPWRWNPKPFDVNPEEGSAGVDNGRVHPVIAGGGGLAVRVNDLVALEGGVRRGRVFLDDYFMQFGDGSPFTYNHGYGAVRFSFGA